MDKSTSNAEWYQYSPHHQIHSSLGPYDMHVSYPQYRYAQQYRPAVQIADIYWLKFEFELKYISAKKKLLACKCDCSNIHQVVQQCDLELLAIGKQREKMIAWQNSRLLQPPVV